MVYVLKQIRTEYAKKMRKQYENHEWYGGWQSQKTYTIKENGLLNTISSVLKDNLLLIVEDQNEQNKLPN